MITVQKDTLSTMDKRLEETEKIGNIYRRLISDLPQDLENFRTVISQTKDHVILELKNSNEEKETRIKELLAAERSIKDSDLTETESNQRLKILKNYLTGSQSEGVVTKKLDLQIITDFVTKETPLVVTQLINSKTVQEYLTSLGYSIESLEEMPDFKKMFKDEPALHVGYATFSENGWYIIRNRELYLHQEMMNSLKDEFSKIKTFKM